MLEVYVSEYPQIRPLSLEYKSLIFGGELDIDKLDSYVLIYRRIESYLRANKQEKRLELARRCFYFKINRSLSRSSLRGTRPWQHDMLSQLVNEWGWTHEGIQLLDARRHWKVPLVASERALLVNELNHSYQFLLEFAQQRGIDREISPEELTVLGRKLQAAFERRPGKIEWINPNISKDISEDVLNLVQEKGHEGLPDTWTAYSVIDRNDQETHTAIRSSSSFVELLMWCYFNKVIETHTYLDLNQVDAVGAKEAKRILSILEQWLPDPQKLANHESFYQAAQPTHALLLLNVGKTPAPELSQFGLQRLSENADALSYGGHEDNLVVAADLLTRNSWREIHARRFDRDNALLDALQEYLQLSLPGTHHSAPELRIECIGSDYAATIAHRVQTWFSEICRCFYGPGGARKRYIFHLSEKFHCLQFRGMRPIIRSFEDEASLLHTLGEEQSAFSGLAVDSYCLRESVIPCIAAKMKRNSVSVFYRRFDIGMDITVSDEKGSLDRTIIRGPRDHNPMIPLHRFLRAAINRQARAHPDLLSDFGICPVYFYEVQLRPGKSCAVRQTPISQNIQQTNIFEVKAIAYSDDDQTIQYDFYCDDQEFSHRSFQDQLFLVVAQFVLSRRDRGENYPIYMTDLDLSSCAHFIATDGNLQISHYLRIKNQLEERLNKAIGVLINA